MPLRHAPAEVLTLSLVMIIPGQRMVVSPNSLKKSWIAQRERASVCSNGGPPFRGCRGYMVL